VRRSFLAIALLAASAGAAPPPRIAILIDDLGNDRDAGSRTLALPAAVGVAVLPMTPYARSMAEVASSQGRDLLLHLPLESLDAAELGPGGVAAGTSPRAIEQFVAQGLASVPGARGVNNHMGSLLTQAHGSMRIMLGALRSRGLYFVDSYTTERSVALEVARELGVPATRRDVFLDPAPGEAVIAEEWTRLLKMARERGVALAIGHPNPTTLGFLERELPGLSARGYQLIKVSEVVFAETSGGNRWHASSSRSPTVARSSKP
jgi:polysaccharide deacetylase 2 family uncharacterized protein YibQ